MFLVLQTYLSYSQTFRLHKIPTSCRTVPNNMDLKDVSIARSYTLRTSTVQRVPAIHYLLLSVRKYYENALTVFRQAFFPIFVIPHPHCHHGKFLTFSRPCQDTDSTTASCRIRACSIR